MTDDLAKFVKGDYSSSGGANVLSYHLIQSFSNEDNLSAEECHRLGQELADQFLGGKYEYVLATHTDTSNMHNHLIFNATSFFDLHKFKSQPYKTVAKIRGISDMICLKNGLSVIKENDIDKYIQRDTKRFIPSFKREIENRIDFVLKESTSYNEFISKIKDMGITVDDSKKHILFKLNDMGQTKNTRGANNYTRDKIKERLSNNKIPTICKTIEQSFISSTSVQEYKANLRQFNVEFKQYGKEVSYELDGNTYFDNSLPIEHQFQQISSFSPLYNFQHIEKKDILERYHEQQDTIYQSDTRVKIPEFVLENLGKDGAIIKYQDNDLYVPKNYLRTNKDKEVYMMINDRFNYTFINTSDSVKGEGLIRYLEHLNGAEKNKIEIPYHIINHFTEKGVYINLMGLNKIYFSNDELVKENGKIYLNVLDKCNFYGQLLPDKNYQKINGKQLINAIGNYRGSIEYTLMNELHNQERRIHTSRLERSLHVLHEEKVSTKKNLTHSIEDLQAKLSLTEKELQSIDERIKQYNTYLKHIISMTTNQFYIDDIKQANTVQKIILQKKYSKQIETYHYSKSILDKNGINTTSLDVSSIKQIIQTNTKNAETLKGSLSDISKRLEKLSEINAVIDSITQCRSEKIKQKER